MPAFAFRKTNGCKFYSTCIRGKTGYMLTSLLLAIPVPSHLLPHPIDVELTIRQDLCAWYACAFSRATTFLRSWYAREPNSRSTLTESLPNVADDPSTIITLC